jgi:hypothetical protein
MAKSGGFCVLGVFFFLGKRREVSFVLEKWVCANWQIGRADSLSLKSYCDGYRFGVFRAVLPATAGKNTTLMDKW